MLQHFIINMSINTDLENYKTFCLETLYGELVKETKKDQKADPLEKVVEKYLNDTVKHLGGLSLKFAPFILNGIPDRLILLKFGKSAYFELKRRGKTPTPLQLERHKQLRELGYLVYVADSKLSVIECLINFVKQC